jgi:ubiquinone/menaquinone biosynthesis C-methylase UbiE
MKSADGIGLADVQAVYSGPEGDLWELIMGEQIHIGGFASSMDLARQAGIAPGSRGVDLCCCSGAGMRFLVRFMSVAGMTGVDATRRVIDRGMARCKAEGLDGKITFVAADVCENPLPDACADFVWGEDAWCYVQDKERLIAQAARLTKNGGTIAFTDWVQGPADMDDAQAQRLLKFMKFPNIQTIPGYAKLLAGSGCQVRIAADTGRFAPYCDLYIDMLGKQLTYDALRIIGWDMKMLDFLAGEMDFMRNLAKAGKIAQGLFVAKKT